MTQIIVYAGAIMVLFLFVVMLLNAPREDVASPYGPAYVTLTTGPRKAFALLSVVLLVELVWALTQLGERVAAGRAAAPRRTCRRCARSASPSSRDHSFAFEVDVGADPRRHGRRRGAREEDV